MWGAIFEFGVIDAKKASTQGTPASLRSFAVFGKRLQFVGSQVVRSMSTSVRQSGPYDAAESLSAAATQTLFPFFFRLSASSMATARNSSRTTSHFCALDDPQLPLLSEYLDRVRHIVFATGASTLARLQRSFPDRGT